MKLKLALLSTFGENGAGVIIGGILGLTLLAGLIALGIFAFKDSRKKREKYKDKPPMAE